MKLKKIWGLALLAIVVAAVCGVVYALINKSCCCCEDETELEDLFEDEDENWEKTFAEKETEEVESAKEDTIVKEETKSEDEKDNTVE